jgi:peptide chain release factor 2
MITKGAWARWPINPPNFGGIFDIPMKEKRLQELAMQAENPDLWNRPADMQKLNKEKSIVEKAVHSWNELHRRVDDGQVLLEMAVEGKDEATFDELKAEVVALEALVADLEIKKMLAGELDANGTYLSINAGAGGTEAQDWADMLYRMYMRYADRHGYKLETLEYNEGDGAGIKGATLLIQGPYAYGHLKTESGVHRLVRVSPFDSNARRHTSFCSVFVWAEVDDDINIVVNPADIIVETYRSSGAGGQHVNKTDSAVRMRHGPSGIVVQCQTQRSQHENRDKAMKMLKAALYEKEIEKRNAAKDALNSTKKANEWGSQIRSYVMHPYQMVKDHRTQHETSQVKDVMDGDLDEFIYSYLKGGEKPKNASGAEDDL